MPYTITITNDSPQPLDFVRFIKNLDFVKVTKVKESNKKKTTLAKSAFSKEVLEASKVLEMTPNEIVEAAEREKMSPEDYAFTMMLSKKINRNISQRLREKFNL